MFNCDIIYLLKILILIKVMRIDEGFTIYPHVVLSKHPLMNKSIIKEQTYNIMKYENH